MLILVPSPAAITIAAQGASYRPNKAFLGVLGVASADVILFCITSLVVIITPGQDMILVLS